MISVIIPSYNSEKTINDCLSALMKQNYPKRNYEIIVVDDGSTDSSTEIVSKFKAVKLVKQKHRGPAAARNLGWIKAKNDVIVFVDSDIAMGKDCLKTFAREIEGYDILVMGKTEMELELDINKFYPPKDVTVVRRNALRSINGYCEIFPWAAAEDTDMLLRAMKTGFKCKSVKCVYRQLRAHKMTAGKMAKRVLCNLVMNFRNIDTKIARQWLLRKFTGAIFLEYLKKRINTKSQNSY